MIRMNTSFPCPPMSASRVVPPPHKPFGRLAAGFVGVLTATHLLTAGAVAAPSVGAGSPENLIPETFNVQSYSIKASAGIPTGFQTPSLSKLTGSNVPLQNIVQAAAELQLDYGRRGHPAVSVVIGHQESSKGTLTMHVFEGAFPQIVISGKRFFPNLSSINGGDGKSVSAAPVSAAPVPAQTAAQRKEAEELARRREEILSRQPRHLVTATPPASGVESPDQVRRRENLEHQASERRARLVPNSPANPVAAANVQTFAVKGYEVIGNTLLAPDLLELVLRPFIGPKTSFELIRQALTDLQLVYRQQGFVTVSVSLPAQKLGDGIVRIRVVEGHLSDINVVNNRHFSSNNVMRALPGLRKDMVLVGPVFQSGLDRANANQDRQIYPKIEPGTEPGTTALTLEVKDRLPLHSKLELNNQNSPGTPDLRANGSLAYNNLWQAEHSAGIQYGFSPESYKSGQDWHFYDRPSVVNYSAFYRMPFGSPTGIEELVASNPGAFGYDEASRKFKLPSPSGRPELNVYASRSTIDTGVSTTFDSMLYNTNGNSLNRQDQQQDATVNNSFGARLSLPQSASENYQGTFSGGWDYKTYNLASHKTNLFTLRSEVIDPNSNPQKPLTNINVSVVTSPVGANGVTVKHLEYLPLSLRYDGGWRDRMGLTTFGLGISGNAWHDGSIQDLQAITGSSKSQGHWVAVTPSLSRDFIIHTNWSLSTRADAQWVDEPLISNEQFGAGGVASVRGYHEGEVFGDNGWRINTELKTPPHRVGSLQGGVPLIVRGSIYTDYAQTYLIDPRGRDSQVSLWGVGFGGVASLGSHWDARVLFSWPLLRTAISEPGQPMFNFALTSQF